MRIQLGGSEGSKILEKLGLTDGTTLDTAKLPDGKTRVRSSSWSEEKIILKDEILEVRFVDGKLRISRKGRFYDESDPYVPPYDPYGPGDFVIGSDASPPESDASQTL